ncbi:hypothetical protein PV10_03806 [Exophiala mesophila]|uniref:N-acetyltransferase domain-containing protein n=1 Tax=Exophiala mesophila TaxID=212818 RepID=A0A0D1WTK2_EXOME|nr:uncharacterized protein PV10_03806 [Exophiala mesophila]KIV92515.1 hypothetical protein PV10_03806 [Exophiala mesophila]
MATQFSLRVLTTRELLGDSILEPLLVMINEVYKHDGDDGFLDRFSGVNDLTESLGEFGICAVVQDMWNKQLPIAMVGAKPWPEKAHPTAFDSQLGCLHWQIGPAASEVSPEYRSKGFVEQCLAALQDRLLQMSSGNSISLWVSVAIELDRNIRYWKRRGFEQIGDPRIVPIGQWHLSKSFNLVDMKKEVGLEA